jgi:hypothetical protein
LVKKNQKRISWQGYLAVQTVSMLRFQLKFYEECQPTKKGGKVYTNFRNGPMAQTDSQLLLGASVVTNDASNSPQERKSLFKKNFDV